MFIWRVLFLRSQFISPCYNRFKFRTKIVQTLCFLFFVPLSCCCSYVLSNGPLRKSCLSPVLAKLRSVVLLSWTVVTCKIKPLFSESMKIFMKFTNFEAYERYRLCYKSKRLPCIFTFRHTHPKYWFLPWAGLEPTWECILASITPDRA